jgi:hypothetical protein
MMADSKSTARPPSKAPSKTSTSMLGQPCL